MKKIILIWILLLIPIAFGEGEEVVVLPNDLTASDTFDGHISDRWNSDYINEWWVSGGNLWSYDNWYHKYLYMPYDFNAGQLRSNYYRFILDFKRDQNEYDTAGLGFKEAINSDVFDVAALIANNKVYFAPDWQSITSKRSKTETDYRLEYILERQGSSNNFDVICNLYKSGVLELKETSTANLSKIYPTIISYKGLSGKFTNFKAYHIPISNDEVTFTQVKQTGNQLDLKWSLDFDKYDHVKVGYSTRQVIDFEDDQVLYDGDSRGSLSMDLGQLRDGYLGIVAYKGDDYSDVEIIGFDYLEAVDDFAYAYTDIDHAYRYTWSDVPGATEYLIEGARRYPGDKSITLYGIDAPENVTIIAKKPASIGSGYSSSLAKSANLADLTPVQNLDYSIQGDQVIISWDHYPAVDHYEVYSSNEADALSKVADDLHVNIYQDTLTNKKVILDYKVKAQVQSMMSMDSEILQVTNLVKNVDHDFDYDERMIQLTWDGIEDADTYEIRVSSHSDMSSSISYHVNSNQVSIPYRLDQENDLYFEIVAKSIDGSSRPIIYVVDMSLNQTVGNLKATYTANSNGVLITWDEMADAVEYHIFKDNIYVGKTSSNSFYDLIKESDPNIVSYAVQAFSSNQSFFRSSEVSTETYEKDVILNLTALYDDAIRLEWSSLFRSTSYILEVSEQADMSDMTSIELTNSSYIYTVEEGGSETLYFRVKGKYNSVESNYSNIASTRTVEDIKLNENLDLQAKHYNEEMKLELIFDLNRQIFSPIISLRLENVLHPISGEPLMSYVYPEVVAVSKDFEIEYTSTIKKGLDINDSFNAQGGYEVLINLEDTTDFLDGDRISIILKTDLEFLNSDRSDPNSILYVSPIKSYTWMELPFFIEDQILRLDTYLNSQIEGDVNPLSDHNDFMVSMSYKHFESDSVRYSVLNKVAYSFQNRNLIQGE